MIVAITKTTIIFDLKIHFFELNDQSYNPKDCAMSANFA